ncbi:uncharacterized protein LOC113564235 [Drosophila erecta]|uniref:Exonuclease domain-containing protein n=1 Tax=Drosophila erecta TaxID=7220 RepID=B3NAN4_DROER|nr:uncharacterized protein LOC6541864 [Drosophila erecta]XP_026835270.1 uncharacterized protein LOC6541864 [Drosophila erecta]XP_026835624.1 uncharacterized protein LOC113564235 [Drosophila erecta]XP_026835625.1 uncharacterized protein LOC113564235 [Drosophila erecta]EDV57557.1 uncharacterized protein Dere_GG24904 [Drosophila erecta]
MAPNEAVVEQAEEPAKISTFAVLDLETSNLPAYQNNRVGITELCIYAFEAALLKKEKKEQEEDQELPAAPRVLHKLNLLFQPSMKVYPEAERITGLSNYILERESKLDVDAAQLINGFLKHLPSPVCLVAHNGWGFDFPILRQIFEKLNVELPQSLTCVDSLRAFMEIDDTQQKETSHLKVLDAVQETQAIPELNPNEETEAAPKEPEAVKEIDWRTRNETTPNRPILTPKEAFAKRKLLRDGNEDDLEEQSPAKRKPEEFRSRRQLFSGFKCAETKRFPPPGVYKLETLFSSKFQRPASSAHQAEADVAMLTKLIQHYGIDFLAFAEEQAIPFHQVVPLGSPVCRKS